MGYKRAEWKSGLTYRQTCEQCKSVVKYTDEVLDFRPWYADGFVYCPKCKTPLRHNEKYAIDGLNESNDEEKNSNENLQHKEVFCPKCGKKYLEDDNYCSKCGNKRK